MNINNLNGGWYYRTHKRGDIANAETGEVYAHDVLVPTSEIDSKELLNGAELFFLRDGNQTSLVDYYDTVGLDFDVDIPETWQYFQGEIDSLSEVKFESEKAGPLTIWEECLRRVTEGGLNIKKEGKLLENDEPFYVGSAGHPVSKNSTANKRKRKPRTKHKHKGKR